MPTLTQLQYIVAIHRTGHFGRAAAECQVSQPTLSAQVARAKEQLGVTLFDRRSTPVVATGPGKRLIAAAQDVLDAHVRLLDAALGSMQLDAGLLATPLGEPGLEGRVVFYDSFKVYTPPEQHRVGRTHLSSEGRG